MPDSDFSGRIPDTDHVVRYLNKRKWCPDDGSEMGPEAFQCPPTEGVSFNWLEYFCEENSVKSLTKIGLSCGLTLRKSGRFLKLNVGDIKKSASEIGSPVSIIYDGHLHGENESHAEIHPPAQATFVALLLCAEQHGVFLRVPSEALSR